MPYSALREMDQKEAFPPGAPASTATPGDFQSGTLPGTQKACSSNHAPQRSGTRPGVGGPADGGWHLPERLRVVLEEVGHAGVHRHLQAVLLKEGAQEEAPGEGSCLRHVFSAEKDTQADARGRRPYLRSPRFLCESIIRRLPPGCPARTPPPAGWLCASGHLTAPLCSPSFISRVRV